MAIRPADCHKLAKASLVTGLVSSAILAIALFAICIGKLAGIWRWIYVVSAVAALYFNFVALVVQAFLKVPVFQALAPTGSEPAFLTAQSALLTIFIILGAAAVIRFHPAARSPPEYTHLAQKRGSRRRRRLPLPAHAGDRLFQLGRDAVEFGV